MNEHGTEPVTQADFDAFADMIADSLVIPHTVTDNETGETFDLVHPSLRGRGEELQAVKLRNDSRYRKAVKQTREAKEAAERERRIELYRKQVEQCGEIVAYEPYVNQPTNVDRLAEKLTS